ncbi:MAG: hypothetical protein ACYTE0_04965 [Planctomycetota bacterium]|jgi:histidinol-phosphate aminotransferase
MGYFRKTIEQMAGYTPGFQPKQADAVKLNTNENPWPASPNVLEAIGDLTAENLQKYPEATGDTFRNAAAAVLGIENRIRKHYLHQRRRRFTDSLFSRIL